jgi:hypothetical protein
MDIKELYNRLFKYSNNIFFENFSSIYVKEFFMYISLKNDKNINIMPFVEIDNILYKLMINNDELYNSINNELINFGNNSISYQNYKNLYTTERLYIEQNNLKILMKEIFNHDTISSFIKKININIYYDNKEINIYNYNNDKISITKNEIHDILILQHNILLNVNRMILHYEKILLNDNYTLNDYITNDNIKLKLSVNMICEPLY